MTKTQKLSITQQCYLLGLDRSSVYYKPAKKREMKLLLMKEMDELHLAYPFMGSRELRDQLRKRGYPNVNRKRVQRLMRQMGMQEIYPKPKTTLRDMSHKTYPYLLRELTIDRANQVWCTDITYIPMEKGFVYLIAVMDWYSRKVLSWRLSNTLDG